MNTCEKFRTVPGSFVSHSGHGNFLSSLKVSCVELNTVLQMWSIQRDSDALYFINYFCYVRLCLQTTGV